MKQTRLNGENPMKEVCRKLARIAAVGCLVVAGMFSMRAALGQASNVPAWSEDVFTVENKYLTLWGYFRDENVTAFDLWTGAQGDPHNPNDNFYIFLIDEGNDGDLDWVSPWGPRLFSAPHPPSGQNADQRPYGNTATIRVDDPAETDGFRELAFPDDGAAIYGPPTPTLPLGQGYFAPYRYEGGTLIVNQKLQFARDLLRVQYDVSNVGGTARRVGVRALLDPFIDYGVDRIDFTNPEPTKSIFLPKTRDRIFFEQDWGQRTGTPTTPRNGIVPDEWEMYDDDEGFNPNMIVKGYLRGLGATTPTRFAVVNSLNGFYPTGQKWDYRTDGLNGQGQELRISDIATLIYWDPVLVPAGSTKSFVTYIGLGVANHGVSDAYLATQQPGVLEPQGFVAAVQTPFSLPLVNGNADTQTSYVDGSIQNVFRFATPANFAFVELPDGLKFADAAGAQTQKIELGSIAGVGSGFNDEATATWTVQATGIEAGLLPVRVTFGNGILDSAQVTRLVNVPQGRLYQFGSDWRMFTFPFSYQNLEDDPAEVFLDENGNKLPSGSFQIVRYNPANVSTPYEQVSQLRAGEGYWIRMLNIPEGASTFVRLKDTSDPIRLGNTDPSGGRSLYTMTLKRGWNQIGNASPYAVRLRDVQFLSGNVLIDWDRAVSAGMVRPAIFEWNRKQRVYQQVPRDSFIQPGRGVWIFSHSERTIALPSPYGLRLSIS
jgi:hypothetical protein